MYTTANRTNWRLLSGLEVAYTTKQLTWRDLQYERTARKSYEFFGLTHDAAKRIAGELRAKYTRLYSIYPDEFAPKAWACTSDIRAVHEEGPIWKVTVDVYEVDRHLGTEDHLSDPEFYFGEENSRDYDDYLGFDKYVKITEAYLTRREDGAIVGHFKAEYSEDIPNEVKSWGWVMLRYRPAFNDWQQFTSFSYIPEGGLAWVEENPQVNAGDLIKLVIGDYESRTAKVFFSNNFRVEWREAL